ncbi:MAG: anthranilate synthase component I, partial [Alphaproteobacteria bacterium CG11_big_fil_rev_8_21_14_0_20_44_7]
MKIFPERNEYEKLVSAQGKSLLWSKINSDLLTPVATMLSLKEEYENCFLFESVEGGEKRGRYSIIGVGTKLLWECKNGKAYIDGAEQQEDVLASLKRIIRETKFPEQADLPHMASGLFGYMGYDMVRFFEELPDNNSDEIGIPDSVLFEPEIVMVFDSVLDVVFVVLAPDNADYDEQAKALQQFVEKLRNPSKAAPTSQQNSDIEFSANFTRAEYHAMVEKAKEYIRAGDIFQIVPSQRFTADFALSPFA